METNKTTKTKSEFPKLLKQAINMCSIENGSNTSDAVLTEYLLSCLTAFEVAVKRREEGNTKQEVISDGEVEKVSDGYYVKKQKLGSSSASTLGIE